MPAERGWVESPGHTSPVCCLVPRPCSCTLCGSSAAAGTPSSCTPPAIPACAAAWATKACSKAVSSGGVSHRGPRATNHLACRGVGVHGTCQPNVSTSPLLLPCTRTLLLLPLLPFCCCRHRHPLLLHSPCHPCLCSSLGHKGLQQGSKLRRGATGAL